MRSLDPKLLAKVTVLWNEKKLTAHAIASQLGITVGSVVGIAYRHKLARRNRTNRLKTGVSIDDIIMKRKSGATLEKIGKEAGVSMQRIQQICDQAKLSRRWRRDESKP